MREAFREMVDGYRRSGLIGGVPGASTDEDGVRVPAAVAAAAADGGGPGGPGLAAAASASLDVTLGRLTEAVDRFASRGSRSYLRDPYAIAWLIPVTGTVILDGSGNGICDLDGPKQGYLWRVRRVSISSSLSFTTSMGAAIGQFYEGIPSDPAAPATMRPQGVVWAFASLPNVATFGMDEVPLAFGEHLVAVVTGGTPNQQLQVSARYQLMSLASQQPALDEF